MWKLVAVFESTTRFVTASTGTAVVFLKGLRAGTENVMLLAGMGKAAVRPEDWYRRSLIRLEAGRPPDWSSVLTGL
jgi:cysteine sulfinate desulfinase/cysteine desulfurase-like protein